MDILFCDRCRESIPDADLDAGRAVRVGGRIYHVACAFRRALPGPGRVALFVLVLLTAGAATYAVVRVLQRDAARPADDAPAAWSKTLKDELAALHRDIQASLDRERVALHQDLDAAVAKARDDVSKEQVAALEAQAKQMKEYVEGWTKTHIQRFEMDEAKLAEIAAWMKEIRDLAARLQSEPPGTPPGTPAGAVAGATPAPSPPPAPEPAAPPESDTRPPTEPAPAPLDAEAQRRHDEEVAKWVALLKDANPSVAYSAAYKLKLLKDPKSVPPIVETLKTQKDFWVRAECATALGAIKSPDAVPALIEALEDKEQYVFASASDALVKITGQDFKNFVLDPSRKERKAYKDQWTKWWKDNEGLVRQRLGQPVAPPK